jgi:hypothetical protein
VLPRRFKYGLGAKIYEKNSDPTDALKKARHYTLFSAELQNNSVLKTQSATDLPLYWLF